MAGQTGTPPHRVSDPRKPLAVEDVRSTDFFQLLRRVECEYRQMPRLGTASRLTQEPIRLTQAPHLNFAPSTVASFEIENEDCPPRLSSYFLGLLGPNGPLPLAMSEYVWDRLHNHNDPTFSRFLDIFHHRMLCLLYRAWAIHQPTVSFDRDEDADTFGIYIASLFGLGSPELRQRDPLPDQVKLFYAGRFSCQARHPNGLEGVLSGYFQLPFQIQEFIAEWVAIPNECRWHLGEAPDTGSLGETITLGSYLRCAQHKFRIILGPVGFDVYQRFLPTGPGLAKLISAVRLYVGDELLWDLNLLLRGDEVPEPKLDGRCRLGWTSWLGSPPFDHDPADMFVEPAANQVSAYA